MAPSVSRKPGGRETGAFLADLLPPASPYAFHFLNSFLTKSTAPAVIEETHLQTSFQRTDLRLDISNALYTLYP